MARLILAFHPDASIELQPIRTTGDRVLDIPPAQIGSKGLFTREIEDALLEGTIDIAVYSLKDLPTRLPDTHRRPRRVG